MQFAQKAIEQSAKYKGKISVTSKVALATKEDLSTAYTPGVAAVCREIAKDKTKAYDLTCKANSVAVVSDGSAVLGLGNIGPEAALPVMEGKAILFKEFGGVDAYPIVLATQNVEEIITIVKNIAPGFGGINLEDISAPRAFIIEERLEDIGIPVFHDDQHGTAIVVLAGLINALKVVGKSISDIKVVISGAGAAGFTIANLLNCVGLGKSICTSVREVIMVDSKGVIYEGRGDLNDYKKRLAVMTNHKKVRGSLADALQGADVFIGVSVKDALSPEWIKKMGKDPIIFAMANPDPEILPDAALGAGAAIVGTGRSDYPNQINNVLAFPGVFRGALDVRAKRITKEMHVAAAHALASCLENPTKDHVIPDALNKKVAGNVARAVAEQYKRQFP
ncbi:NADP-dependent malic enzyme [Candidatus Woesearchaeota archaeon]|nr:MAG: malate dehydrogenase oxaloacetate-decarboxylating [archaeon GW2011_AR4]MBS3130247.1 NADP-dependent malic enzyme [Candidatus Woesearchaeota archaeon]HIH38178.1 NADP-dependent malic enzyme [Candidatus Woesearchaeota archaeon]HIH49473.1 NADP-dependent malic enzyme [Candidatus Woesearchaeota archaeon]HIJ03855.1 NADP-dependent malic enzyme [Candidatus Woesearchaeota archaeon]